MQETSSQVLDLVEAVTEEHFIENIENIYSLYARAFVLSAERKSGVMERFKRHIKRTGFTSCACYSSLGHLRGIVYGFQGVPGDWWHERVRDNLRLEVQEKWMRDSFEIAEVAVDPDFHGRGIGFRMMQFILEKVHQKSALLTVRVDNHSGKNLYQKCGFETLIDKLAFAGDPDLYAVMGIDLAKRSKQEFVADECRALVCRGRAKGQLFSRCVS